MFVWGHPHTDVYAVMWVNIKQKDTPGHVPVPSACCIEPPVKPCKISASTGDSSRLSFCGRTPTHQGRTPSQSRTLPTKSGNFIIWKSILLVVFSIRKAKQRSQGQAVVLCWVGDLRLKLCYSKSPWQLFSSRATPRIFMFLKTCTVTTPICHLTKC